MKKSKKRILTGILIGLGIIFIVPCLWFTYLYHFDPEYWFIRFDSDTRMIPLENVSSFEEAENVAHSIALTKYDTADLYGVDWVCEDFNEFKNGTGKFEFQYKKTFGYIGEFPKNGVCDVAIDLVNKQIKEVETYGNTLVAREPPIGFSVDNLPERIRDILINGPQTSELIQISVHDCISIFQTHASIILRTDTEIFNYMYDFNDNTLKLYTIDPVR